MGRESDTEPSLPQDVLTCGGCQKPFPLSDIVKFIQHKVVQACSKEHFALALAAAAAATAATAPAAPASPAPADAAAAAPAANSVGGNGSSTDSDDGGAGAVVSTRRPSISAPITTKKAAAGGVRGATPPPPDLLPPDGASTPKRRPASPADAAPPPPAVSPDTKPNVKQEPGEEDHPCTPAPHGALKRPRADTADAESNTTHSEPSHYVCVTCKQRLHSAWRLLQHAQNTHGLRIYAEPPCPAPSAPLPPAPSACPPFGPSGSSSSGCSPSSGSSPASSSSGSSSKIASSPSGGGLALPPPPPPGGRLLPPPPPPPTTTDPHALANSFAVGGLLRLPGHPSPFATSPTPLGNHLGSSSGSSGTSSASAVAAAAAALFARPSAHHDHHFRMEQLMSEQLRLGSHHGLGLAAAVAAAAAATSGTSPAPATPTGATPGPFVPPPGGRSGSTPNPSGSGGGTSPAAPPPPSLSLPLEPQMDFYSQRLRQLAGTTSPGAAGGGSGSGASGTASTSPSPRRQLLTPPFTSPSGMPPATSASTPTPLALNSSSSNNLNSSRGSSSPGGARPECLSSPEKQSPLSDPITGSAAATALTPRSASTPPHGLLLKSSSDLSGAAEDRVKACEFCGKKFRFESNLVVHRRTHTGEKPYKCSICNHACSQSSKLKRHMKVHRRALRANGEANGSSPRGDDAGSHAGSVDTLDEDGDDEDEDDEDDDDDDDEDDEEEEMELDEEDGEDDDDEDLGGDAPEDLTTKSTSSTPPNNNGDSANNNNTTTTNNNSEGSGKGDGGVERTPRPTPTATPLEKLASSGSLVGELMDKFGLSNIQQYSEAYKQALQESVVGSHHLHIKDDLHRSPLIPDNNNSGGKATPPTPLTKSVLENGVMEKSAAAMRFREEFAKNLMSGQPPLDLMSPHGLFAGAGAGAFDNPFDAASKRLKLDLDGHHAAAVAAAAAAASHAPTASGLGSRHDRDALYAGLWLPAMAAAHHRSPADPLFGGPGSDVDLMRKDPNGMRGPGGGKPGPNPASTLAAAAAAAAALNLGLPPGGHGQPPPHLKKDSRRNDTCEFCGKVFKNCSNLTVHRRSHTGEKPYKCELCSYACAQSSKLTRHMKTHGRLGKDVYRCRFCEMPFSVPSTLEKHMRKCVVNQNNKVVGASGLLLPPALLKGEDTGDSSSASKDAT